MKLNKFNILIVAIILMIGACVKPDNLVPTNSDWDGEGFPVGGGLLDMTTPSIAYVVGNQGPYNVEFRVYQGESNFTTKVDVYVKFHHFERILAVDGSDSLVIEHISSEKLLSTIDQSGKTTTHFDILTFMYADLVEGMTDDEGNPLPTDDTQLSIGDYFELTFMSTVENGDVFKNYQGVKATVSGRYAGTWKVTEMMYERIGVLRPDVSWKGETITLESVNATTYKYTSWGASQGFGVELLFSVNPTTLIISYPEGQILNDFPLITPITNATDFVGIIAYANGVGFSTYNIAINDDVNGADRLVIIYGYFNPANGARTFFEVLDKVVE